MTSINIYQYSITSALKSSSYVRKPQSNSSKWIKENLPDFRFAQIIYVIDQMLNTIINSDKKLIGIKLNRDEKRSYIALCRHLDRYWDLISPHLTPFIVNDEIKNDAIKKFNLND